ncbi:MAG: hypothetical protein J3Q66DRAFT_348752 [Benniella sp.]|nr:MAG: hypothetical protein J3Q66DRAFT_348752 [Benniella sp.]
MSTRHARTADKSTNDKHARLLKALLQKPENKFCVDCRKKDPRWASFNLGCFMCIRCSGIHRSMGTHISKVKSVDLDSWTVVQVESMIKWGNEKVNLYWEDRLPESSIPNENTSGIDHWIRSKYEHKRFARNGPVPDPSELGPIDEDMLMGLHGQSDSRSQGRNRSAASSAATGMIAPPPSNPAKSSFPMKHISSSSSSSGIQGADLFSIGQSSPVKAPSSQPKQIDVFGFDFQEPAPSVRIQSPNPVSNTASQDLFSMKTTSTLSPAPPSANDKASAATAKAANTDWKNSIMSLYGNQSSTPKPNAGGFSMSQPSGSFGQLQGMDAFGLGQPQKPQLRKIDLAMNDPFATMQQAPAPAASFNAFSMGPNHSNNEFRISNEGYTFTSTGNGYSSNGYSRNSNNASAGALQGGIFSTIAGAQSSVTSPPSSTKKNDSVFGDLTWN